MTQFTNIKNVLKLAKAQNSIKTNGNYIFLPFSHRNVMMRLNLQLTMGSFSLTLFGLIGVAFGMNLTSTFEEVMVPLKIIF